MNETNVGLSELPEGWTMTTLGEIHLDLSQSINPRTMSDQLFELYSVPSFVTGKPEITQGNNIGSSKRIIQNEAVLLCKINPRINRIWVVENHTDYPQIASTEWIPFFNLQGLEPRYLCYFLTQHCLRDFLASNVSGVGGSLIRIKPTTFANYPFPIAPLSEQHRIVAKIEELFTKLDAGKEELLQAKARLKRYRQSVLKAAMDGELTEDWRKNHESETESASVLLDRILKERREKWEAEQLEQMIVKGKTPKDDKWKNKYKEPQAPDTSKLSELPEGWVWTNIQQLSKVSGGLTKHSKRNTYPMTLPYLRVANVYADELRLEEIKDIGVKKEELNRVLLKDGDMLVVEGNGSPDQIGRVAIWNGSISPCAHQNHIIKARFDPVEIGMYCIYWLLSIEGRKYISQVASSTSGLYTLSISKVQALPVPIPPLREQQVIIEEIDRYLSVADAVEATVDAELKRSDALRQSILKQAFSGKLVPQDPNDEPAEKLLARIKKEKAKREVDQKTKRKTKKQLALFEH